MEDPALETGLSHLADMLRRSGFEFSESAVKAVKNVFYTDDILAGKAGA